MVACAVLFVGLMMMAIEQHWPARPWPRVRGFWLRAFGVSGLQAAVVYLAGRAWEPWMKTHALLEGHRLGSNGGAVIGYVVLAFVYYGWHRARHEVPFLWRWVHQLHHSPQRIEVVTSFYKHPIELVANGLLSSAVMYLLLGLSPQAAAGATLLSGLAELFYHWNVATPRWLGYLVQRPEMHCVHHEEGQHRSNYGDLPIFDLLFGTFKNPPSFKGRCGFGHDEMRIGDMLRGVDVNEPRRHPTRGRRRLAIMGVLGFSAMAASVCGAPRLQAITVASTVAPLPKVFTSHRGWETFSSDFEVAIDHGPFVLVDTARAQGLRGPYNRRNVFGAVLAYGPVLARDPSEQVRDMFDAVSVRAVCPAYGAPVLHELDLHASSSPSLPSPMAPSVSLSPHPLPTSSPTHSEVTLRYQPPSGQPVTLVVDCVSEHVWSLPHVGDSEVSLARGAA